MPFFTHVFSLRVAEIFFNLQKIARQATRLPVEQAGQLSPLQ